jgi:S1-C subfamily serine protease
MDEQHNQHRRRRVRLGRGVVAAGVIGAIPLLAVPAFAASSSNSISSNGDVAAISAHVDPGIVDITTTLTNGTAAGTGMVLTSSGEVLTNNHVTEGATAIQVQVDGTGPVYRAVVLGYDVTADVALLQLQGASGLPTISTAPSASVAVGEDVVGLGNALGRGGTPAVAVGSVTAVGQTITASDEGGANPEQFDNLIQVDAPIRPGDSGGPLVNADGKVIGMDSAGSSAGAFSRRAATEGYAIPIDDALAVAHEIEAGRASDTVHIGARAILGVEVSDQSSWFAPSAAGVTIGGVESGGPAETAGLASGDTITAIDGHTVATTDDVASALGSERPGDSVRVQWVDADGASHAATVTLEAGPPA